MTLVDVQQMCFRKEIGLRLGSFFNKGTRFTPNAVATKNSRCLKGSVICAVRRMSCKNSVPVV